MSHPLRPVTIDYASYELREEAFNRRVSRLIPCKYAGPTHFWREFLQITQEGVNIPDRLATAYITANPRDCLAFGTARQVLAAAAMLTSRHVGQESGPVAAVAERFGLAALLNQPIRTLSGGETVKLALAKVYLASHYTERLTIASPFCWLSHANAPLLEATVDQFRRLERPVEILTLTGEESRQPMPREFEPHTDFSHLAFTLQLDGVRIPLGGVIDSVASEPQYARVRAATTQLISPCLVVGDNGQGKSLLAKTLAKAVDHQGWARIRTARKPDGGRVRLLFQDVITQTMLRSRSALMRSERSFRNDAPNAQSIYESIRSAFLRIGGLDCQAFIDSPISLIRVKLALVAVRLCGHPAALILDEPDWGLPRRMAIAFVLAVIQTADHLEIPVLLVSHKPWWRPMAASLLAVTKTNLTATGSPAGKVRFEISVAAIPHPGGQHGLES